MADKESDQDLVKRVSSLLEDVRKKTYEEAFNEGRRVGHRDAQAAWEFAAGSFAGFFAQLEEEAMPDPSLVQAAAKKPKAAHPEADVNGGDFVDFVTEVAKAIQARAASDLPAGVSPDDLGFIDGKRVRQAFRQLMVTGGIHRVAHGRYLPVAAVHQEEVAAN